MPTIVNFAYTGAMQTAVVPAGVESATFEVWGAQGVAWYSPTTGGYGAFIGGTLPVIPGQTYNIFVGGQPTTHSPPTNGGYNGGGVPGGDTGGGGGGGASDIRFGGTALADRILVGGGGGGGGYTGGSASHGGYPNGLPPDYEASGGLQNGPGPRGSQLGTLGIGASGGPPGGGTRGAGGGGGGRWGGNSNVGHNSGAIAGGGGSSYIGGALTLTTAEASGTRTGNGLVRITWADPVNIIDMSVSFDVAVVAATSFGPRRPTPQRSFLYVRNLKGVSIGVLT